ncbi:hypothetical protein VPH35_011166 [Triticum aestivum]
MPTLSDEDKDVMKKWGAPNKIDFLSLSYTRHAEDAAAKKIEESNVSSDSESSDSDVFIYLLILKWKLHHLIAFLIIFLPDFTMSHFIGFQKPSTEVKNSAVATAQKKNQELDGFDSDSDDSSDEDMATKRPVAKKVVESSESSDSDSEEDTTAKPVQSSKAVAVIKNLVIAQILKKIPLLTQFL